jgi:hypothetical protein
MLRNGSDVAKVLHILVCSRVEGHKFRPNGEPLLMLVLLFDINKERKAVVILLDHFYHEVGGQVDSLNNDRLAPIMIRLEDLT